MVKSATCVRFTSGVAVYWLHLSYSKRLTTLQSYFFLIPRKKYLANSLSFVRFGIMRVKRDSPSLIVKLLHIVATVVGKTRMM
jgi:hypothetical protein